MRLGREERRMRTTESERHAQPLRVAEHHVRAHLAGRRDYRQGQEIGRDGDQCPPCVRARDERTQVVEASGLVRVLNERAERPRIEGHVAGRADLELDAQRFGTAPQHRQRLWEHAIGHEEHAAIVTELLRLRAVQERHRSAARSSERRVGHVHRGQVGDHGLEVEERFGRPWAISA